MLQERPPQRCCHAGAHRQKYMARQAYNVNLPHNGGPTRRTIGDHVDAVLIMSGCLEVQVSHQDVCRDCSTSLMADHSSSSTLLYPAARSHGVPVPGLHRGRWRLPSTARRSTVLRRDPGLAADTRWPPATLLNHQGRCRPMAIAERRSSFGEDRTRARSAGAGMMRRSASSCSSSVRVPCEPLLRSEELPPRAGTDAGGAYSVWLCKTHLLPLCSVRRPSMPLCLARRHRLPAGRPARRMPARAQLPAGPLRRCSPSAVP